MERVTELLVVERHNSDMFQLNFNKLKQEYDRLVYENSKLSDEIALIKQMKSQPLDNLKRQLVKLEEEVEKKNSIISSFQDKCHSQENVIEEKCCKEVALASKITSTEMALEQTCTMLASLQFEVSSLSSTVETAQMKDDAHYRKLLLELSNKCNQLEKEKKFIAQEVMKVTGKASKNLELLKLENLKLTVSMEKLKDTLGKMTCEKSQLSTDLEWLKVQRDQEKVEYLMQIRNLECQLTTLQGKNGMLEKSYQDTFQDREKCKMAFQSTQNENISLKTQLYELEFKCEKGEERYKNELHHLKDLHQIEKASLDKRICDVEHDFCIKRSNVEELNAKLQCQEKELIVYQNRLREKDMEFGSRVQDLRTEDRQNYRVISEEKLQVELESAKKISELESQIILERNLKMNIEKQLSQASSEIELLNERSKLVADCLTEIKGLKVEAELRENEKKRIVDEFDRYRHLKEEKHESLSKEMDQTNLRRLDLQNEKDELLEKMQILRVETQSNIQYIQTQLETTQKKSQRYAGLIWKLRRRLSESQKSPIQPFID